MLRDYFIAGTISVVLMQGKGVKSAEKKTRYPDAFARILVDMLHTYNNFRDYAAAPF